MHCGMTVLQPVQHSSRVHCEPAAGLSNTATLNPSPALVLACLS